MSKSVFLSLLLFAGTFISVRHANASGDIFINEVAWMGTTEAATNEWIELYNGSPNKISLTDWVLISDDSSPNITLSGEIESGGFFLLERTDDNTIPGVSANQFYTGSLVNTGENLKLLNNNGVLLDEINGFASGWPAGDNSTKQTMEKNTNGSWNTSLTVNGTPKAQNSIWQAPTQQEPPPQPAAPPEPSSTEQPQTPPQDQNQTNPQNQSLEETPDTETGQEQIAEAPEANGQAQDEGTKADVFLSELIPNPKGTDSDLEFIEIVNLGASAVDLSGWSLLDPAKTFVIENGAVLEPQKYLVFYAKETHINLNNDGNTIKLLDNNGLLKDGVRYGETKEGLSLIKIENSWSWTNKQTPGKKNERSADLEESSYVSKAPEVVLDTINIAEAPDTTESVLKNKDTAKEERKSQIFTKSSSTGAGDEFKARSFPLVETLKDERVFVLFGALLFGILSGLVIFFVRKKFVR